MRLSLSFSSALIVAMFAPRPALAACPGSFATAVCNPSGVNICTMSADAISCDMGAKADTNGSNAKFVTDSGTFQAYGYEGNGDAFCCEFAQGVNCTFDLEGTYQVDTVTLYDTVRSLDLDCNDHEVHTEDEDDYIGGSRLSGPFETLDGDNDDDTIHGNAGNEHIIGDVGYDLLYGDAGDDTIEAGGNDDIVYGGEGIDTITGGTGNDEIHGGDDDDTIDGEGGDDDIYGDDGDDTLNGGDDSDLVCGGNDVDTLYGDAGNDFVHGQWGTDTINDGGAGVDKCEPDHWTSCATFFSTMICTR